MRACMRAAFVPGAAADCVGLPRPPQAGTRAGRQESHGSSGDHRGDHHRLERVLRAARPARDHLGALLHRRRLRRRRVGARLARRLRGVRRRRAHHRGRARAAALQRRGPARPARAPSRAGVADPSPADRAAADDGRRGRSRRARLPRHGARVRRPALDDAGLDRRGARPEGRHRHVGAGPRAAGARRGERAQRRPRRALLPRRPRHRQRRAQDRPDLGGRRATRPSRSAGGWPPASPPASSAACCSASPTAAAGSAASGGRSSRWPSPCSRTRWR